MSNSIGVFNRPVSYIAKTYIEIDFFFDVLSFYSRGVWSEDVTSTRVKGAGEYVVYAEITYPIYIIRTNNYSSCSVEYKIVGNKALCKIINRDDLPLTHQIVESFSYVFISTSNIGTESEIASALSLRYSVGEAQLKKINDKAIKYGMGSDYKKQTLMKKLLKK